MKTSELLEYRICTRCVMDTSDKKIVFNEKGECNHCLRYDSIVRPQILSAVDKQIQMEVLIGKVIEAGKGNKYDCLIGLSGGMDSSYVVYLAKKHNLRPIIVHFDNGWDSELAVKNIENIIKRSGFDYYNYIVDWEEFRDLQRAYFKASVVDVEVPTDMGIFSLIPKLAIRFGVKYILFGANIETESTMGADWNFPGKMDRSNLEDIYKKYGEKQLRTFPYLSPIRQLLYRFKDIKQVNVLLYDECDYRKIKEILVREFEWRDYGVKHGESTFTRYYQSSYLVNKFFFDKRRAHFSDQINSGHFDRKHGLELLKLPVYKNKEEEMQEKKYVCTKLGFSENEFDKIMRSPSRSHFDFRVNGYYGNWFDQMVLTFLNCIMVTRRMLGKVYRQLFGIIK